MLFRSIHLKDALKIVVGRRSGTEPRTNQLLASNRSSMKHGLPVETMLSGHPLMVPTDLSHGDGQ